MGEVAVELDDPLPSDGAAVPPLCYERRGEKHFEGSRGLSSSLFGLGTPGLKPRDVLGEWSAVEPGATYACQVRLTREAFAGGYRVFTSGCRGPLGGATAWRFEETLAGLYGPDGAAIAKLGGDKKRLAGKTTDGRTVELSR